jgi:hypothetical protein
MVTVVVLFPTWPLHTLATVRSVPTLRAPFDPDSNLLTLYDAFRCFFMGH